MSRLTRDHVDTETKSRGKKKSARGGRCQLHSLETRKPVTTENWKETWDCMEQKCREEVVLIPYSSIRVKLDGYLKKHKFCSDCSRMINKAYYFLTQEGKVCLQLSRIDIGHWSVKSLSVCFILLC